MKLFADHCFFQCGVELLRQAGYDVIKAIDVGLETASDDKIVSFCKKEDRVIITLDTDFSSLYRFPLGSHCGIIVFRITPFTPAALLTILAPIIKKKIFDSFKNALVIVKRNKIRIIRSGNIKETL